jgi:TetR/AcrR family transcriptional regulator, repressor of fatR-cypB operon
MLGEDQIHKGEKREAILQAALELIVEQGLQHTPMSLISKRSGASAGIIYHYFESKEDLLASLYRRIKEDMGRAIVAADDPRQPLAKRFQTLWLSIFRYCLAHPQEMAFLVQYESSPEAKQQNAWREPGTKTLDDLIGDLRALDLIESLPPETKTLYGLIADLQAQDLLKNLPLVVIGEFTLGVALRLAQQAAAGLMSSDEATLTEIARACWDAIAR